MKKANILGATFLGGVSFLLDASVPERFQVRDHVKMLPQATEHGHSVLSSEEGIAWVGTNFRNHITCVVEDGKNIPSMSLRFCLVQEAGHFYRALAEIEDGGYEVNMFFPVVPVARLHEFLMLTRYGHVDWPVAGVDRIVFFVNGLGESVYAACLWVDEGGKLFLDSHQLGSTTQLKSGDIVAYGIG